MLALRQWITFCALILCCAGRAGAGSLHATQLQAQLNRLAEGFDGRVGVCVLDTHGPVCVAGDERFSMQSVMKLVVAMAVMDAVDHGKMHLGDPIIVRHEDLSVYVQPIAKLVGPTGYSTNIEIGRASCRERV